MFVDIIVYTTYSIYNVFILNKAHLITSCSFDVAKNDDDISKSNNLMGYRDSNAVVATENVLRPLKTTASVSTSTGSPQQAAEPFSSVSSAADDRTPVDDRTETDEDTTGSVRSPSANDDPKPEPADIRRVAPPSSVSSEKLMSLFVPWWAAPPTALVTPPPWGFPKLFRVAGIP